ncbi:DUF214 family protein [Cavenderia fasciculata]|uniref:DUF214 family protein n=1 Tax=Cavenderia fasciculata TaxID=261658 RepID=F4PTU1_CACFS|nr:DUF214 family protein [Cavenderia fasciculata]EGG20920.1 DUF214 family protein [Cavenderia fasciculata]|eukprot:XP_004358770.1 DUF214 family protein [Cavenderia fasciculata]
MKGKGKSNNTSSQKYRHRLNLNSSSSDDLGSIQDDYDDSYNDDVDSRLIHNNSSNSINSNNSNNSSNNGNSNHTSNNNRKPYKYEDISGKNKPRWDRFMVWLRSTLYFMKHVAIHTVNNNRRNKLSYFLGFSACFLVVFVVSLCVSIISNTPVVFLNLSEVSVGEMDMVLSSNSGSSAQTSLNYTLASSLLQDDSSDTYHSPRILASSVTVVSGICGYNDPNNLGWKYGVQPDGTKMDCIPNCFTDVCLSAPANFGDLYVIDTKREDRMGLGRAWTMPSVPYGQVYLQSDLASSIHVAKGDSVYIELNVQSMISNLFWNANLTMFMVNGTYPPIILTMKVADTFSSGGGKFGKDESTAIIIEYDQFLPFIYTQLNPLYPQSSFSYINSSNLYDYADNIVVNLPPSRLEPYINSNQDTILQNLIKFSSKILYKLGFNEISSQLPVMKELSKNRYVALFLGLILNVIIFILLFLSILLIYSLLMIDVETRTFEMGVMRMIGTTRNGIIQLMLCKAFSYSLPSWVFGLLFAQLFGVVVSKWFASITGVPIPPRLTTEGVLLATLLGMIIPIAASIFPIKNALGKNLHDSLDSKHSKTMAVQISIERSEDNSFSTSVAVIGLILAVFGFGIYYIFPLSLLSFNLTLLLNMFFLLLISMLLGLVLLALNVEHLLERLIVFAFLFWEKKAIPAIVRKNLVAHKLRNRKTAIMYAVSLAFIIFVNVSYSTQQASLNYQVLQRSGSYLRVNGRANFSPSDAQGLENFVRGLGDSVESFSWISSSFPTFAGVSWSPVVISTVGHIYWDTNHVYAISPNYFETGLSQFLKVGDVSSDPDYTLDPLNLGLSQQMYSTKSSNGLLIGALYQSWFDAQVDANILFKTTIPASYATRTAIPGSPNITTSLAHPIAMIKSAPGLGFSEFPSVTNQDAAISIPSAVAFAIRGGAPIDSVRNMMTASLLIKARDGDTSNVRSQLETYISTMTASASLFDYDKEIAPNKTASDIIQYFFSFTTVIAMVISFFSLMSSMFTNIYEQTKEIGVLRAIGIPKSWMVRIYIYESFVLVFSSSLLGVFIGSLVGWTMILQRVLFTQLPIPFIFPWVLLIVIFICSVIFSFISAFGPIRKVLNQQVVVIMRLVS